MKKLLITAALFLTACAGYSPLYDNIDQTTKRVVVGTIAMKEVVRNVGERRVAQLVAQNLSETLTGSGSANDYTLNVIIEEEEVSLAVQRDSTDVRLSLRLKGYVSLLDADGNEVYTARENASAAYNVEDSPFGTDAGRDFARASAADVLSDDIIYTITRFMRQNAAE